ncbi:MAG: phosphoribosylglycinamide formyltransferase [Balneolaceae bacterium]
MKQLVVFASGSGSNFQSIINAVQNGQINARVAGLVSNNADAYSVERALKNDIPFIVLNPLQFESEADYIKELLQQLANWKADILILAGYLKKIPLSVIEAYPKRILNIHPSLLPKYGGKGYYGMNVHKAVIEAKEKESGCTVHLVSKEYDDGPILGQAVITVHENETPEELAQRVLNQEHKLYPVIIQQYIETINNS